MRHSKEGSTVVGNVNRPIKKVQEVSLGFSDQKDIAVPDVT